MFKRFLFYLLPGIFAVSCNNDKTADQQSTAIDSSATKSQPAAQLSTLPSFVVFRNWEQRDPENSELILNTYKAWDSDSTGAMSTYFSDTTTFGLPDGLRFTTT